MSSIYHILDRVPAIYPEDMQLEYEQLAQLLIKSGKLRIDTDTACNFARFSDPKFNVSAMISKEEITDPSLTEQTNQLLRSLYQTDISDQKIAAIYDDLKKQINKLQPVSQEITEKLARIFVQSAHPIVIKWLLWDKVQVFITYSHSIGDVMDVIDWQRSGSNSGMQSTDGKNVAIFVSCGGDPFAKNNELHPTYGDGWAAVARLQIVAGQEIGHFADIKRDTQGRQITRHSANFSGTKPTPHVRKARRDDIAHCKALLTQFLDRGMKQLIQYEEKVKFYNKNNVGGVRVYWAKCLGYFYKNKFLSYANRNKLYFIKRFAKDQYMGLMIRAMIEDMLFNLAPVADVYKHSDPEVEETIACIEALARVPQQVMKWGYLTTMETMVGLYKVYYNEVIPSLINNYTIMTKQSYKRNMSKPRSTFLHKINIFNKNKLCLVPVRDL
jgi:hypothetical protein